MQTRSFTKAELVSPPKIDRGPLGGFEPLLTLPTPDASKLRRPSLRATLKTVIELYFDRINQMSLAATPNSEALVEPSICQFIYKEFVSKYGVVKLAEHNIVEVWVLNVPEIASCNRPQFPVGLRCQDATLVIRPPYCHVWTPVRHHQHRRRQPGQRGFCLRHHGGFNDQEVHRDYCNTIEPEQAGRYRRAHRHYEAGMRTAPATEDMAITRLQIAQAVIDSIFSNDTLLFRTAVFKQAVSRTQGTAMITLESLLLLQRLTGRAQIQARPLDTTKPLMAMFLLNAYTVNGDRKLRPVI